MDNFYNLFQNLWWITQKIWFHSREHILNSKIKIPSGIFRSKAVSKSGSVCDNALNNFG